MQDIQVRKGVLLNTRKNPLLFIQTKTRKGVLLNARTNQSSLVTHRKDTLP